MKKSILFFAFAVILPGWVTEALSQSTPALSQDVAVSINEISNPHGLKLEKIAEGFESPVNVTNAGDGSHRIFVVERLGKIKIIDKNDNVLPRPFLNLRTLRPTVINPMGNDVQSSFIEQGLFSVAFHPQFNENGYIFVHYSSLRYKGAGVISRFTVNKDTPNYISSHQAKETEKEIMVIKQPSQNNNGGQIEFGPDGYLYIGLGDGGWGSSKNVSQENSSRLGKILRIDINTEKPYIVPETNPFASSGGSPENEIWAKGFHNPYKFSFDKKNGDLFIADVGDNTWEEINYIPKNSGGGANFGWPKMEGADCFLPVGKKVEKKCTIVGQLPIAQYKHPKDKPIKKSSEAFVCASVQGLGVANYAGMNSSYLFGDWCSGSVFGVTWDENKWRLDKVMNTKLHITAGGNDESGNVLALSAKFYFDDENKDRPPYGTVWRVVKK